MAEFAPAVLAARLGLSAYAGARLVADVLDLSHRLPLLWARVQAGEVGEGHARHVARKTRGLSLEEAACVDARVATSADGRVSWSRFETLVEAAIVAADPDAAAAREEAAARDTFAKATRSTEHGMRGFYVRADFATIARIDATVAYLARVLLAMGDTTTLDQRRVKAVLILANPVQAVKILTAHQQWHHTNTQPARADPEPEPERIDEPEPEPVDTTPRRFDPTEAADLLDEARLLPAVWLYVHLAGSDLAPVAGRGIRPGHHRLGPHPPRPALPVQDHPGPGPPAPGPRRCLRDPRPTSTRRAPADPGRHLPLRRQHHPQHADRPHHRLVPSTRRGRREAVPHRQLRPHDRPPPPDQDPRPLERATTLPRPLPLARPPRSDLPRRPHRHPPIHPDQDPDPEPDPPPDQ